MLEEKEFFIRKAIGWILRETAKKRPRLVIEFVGERVDRIAGLTLREAVPAPGSGGARPAHGRLPLALTRSSRPGAATPWRGSRRRLYSDRAL